MEQVTLTILFIVAIILVIGYLKKKEKERTEGMAKVAKTLGYQFLAKSSDSLKCSYSHFYLFSQGHSKRMKNVVFDGDSTSGCYIFDYQYSTGSGKHRSTSSQTVFSFINSAFDFPDFDLRPEHIFHKIGNVFGYQDIDFDINPEFSSKYLLRGKNENEIRSLFNDKLLKYFEQNNALSVEARGNKIIVYNIGRKLEPEQIGSSLNKPKQVFLKLCSASDT